MFRVIHSAQKADSFVRIGQFGFCCFNNASFCLISVKTPLVVAQSRGDFGILKVTRWLLCKWIRNTMFGVIIFKWPALTLHHECGQEYTGIGKAWTLTTGHHHKRPQVRLCADSVLRAGSAWGHLWELWERQNSVRRKLPRQKWLAQRSLGGNETKHGRLLTRLTLYLSKARTAHCEICGLVCFILQGL